MIPFTTPKHIFRLPFSTEIISEAKIYYKQNGELILEKAFADCTTEGNNLILKLTQEETGLFEDNIPASVQVRVITTGGESWATRPKRVTVDEILKREVL